MVPQLSNISDLCYHFGVFTMSGHQQYINCNRPMGKKGQKLMIPEPDSGQSQIPSEINTNDGSGPGNDTQCSSPTYNSMNSPPRARRLVIWPMVSPSVDLFQVNMDFHQIPLNASQDVTDPEGECSGFLQLMWQNTLTKCSLEEEIVYLSSTTRSIMKIIQDWISRQEHRPRKHRRMLLVNSPLAGFQAHD